MIRHTGRTGAVLLFALGAAAFEELCQKQPDIAIKLLTALGHELSVRIRYANLTIQQLET